MFREVSLLIYSESIFDLPSNSAMWVWMKFLNRAQMAAVKSIAISDPSSVRFGIENFTGLRTVYWTGSEKGREDNRQYFLGRNLVIKDRHSLLVDGHL